MLKDSSGDSIPPAMPARRIGDTLLSLIAAAILLEAVSADAATWGVAGGDWNTATNWNPAGAPNNAVAQIDNAGTANVTANALYPITALRIGYAAVGASGTLNIGADFTAADSSTIGRSGVGTLNITGGVVQFNGAANSLRLGELASGVGNIMQSGGAVSTANLLAIGVNGTNNSTYTLAAGTFTNGSHFSFGQTAGVGTMNQSGGTFVCNGTGQAVSYIGQSATGTLNLSGGTFLHLGSGGVYLGSSAGGVGTVNQTGGSLTVVNNLIVGVSGRGDYSIANGSLSGGGSLTVGGSGAVGGAFTVGPDASVNFGVGFNLGSTGTNDFVFGTNGVSQMVFGGAGTINAAGVINVDGSAYAGGPASFTLIQATSFSGTPVINLTGFAVAATNYWNTANGKFIVSVGLPPPPTPSGVSLWAGGSPGGSWSAAGNWIGGVPTNNGAAWFGTNFIGVNQPTMNAAAIVGQIRLMSGLATNVILGGSSGLTFYSTNAVALTDGCHSLVVEPDVAGGLTITAPLTVRLTTVWRNDSTNPLTVGGNVTFSASSKTLTIGGNGDTVINGNILMGNLKTDGKLEKKHRGTLTLSGTNAFDGGTTVSGGALVVNGSLASGVTVKYGTVLAGRGGMGGPVLIEPGGRLSPGVLPSPLTISNDLTLAGDLVMELNKSVSPSNDWVLVTGTLTNAGQGTLTLVNTGPPLTAGDSFRLFNKPLANGQALNLVVPSGTGIVWTNKLAADGSIAVVFVPAVNPARFTAEFRNNQLVFSWPWVQKGWILETQTNSLTAGNWTPLPESAGTNWMALPVDLINTCVFYRLVAPPEPVTAAYDPSPSHGWQRADPQGMVRWSAGGRASYKVYFGTNPAPGAAEFRTNQTAKLYYPGPLNTNTTYYWRIDVVDGTNVIGGGVWSFKTGSLPGLVNNINLLPNQPTSYLLRDWREVALKYHQLTTNFAGVGQYLPVVWWDDARANFDLATPFIPSFVGIPQGGDALNLFGTIIGSTLVGIDMSNQGGYDWVRSMVQFQGTSVGRKVVGNNKTGQRSSGLWYDVVPGIYFSEAVELYPQVAQAPLPYSFQSGGASMETVMYETASKWYEVLDFLGGSQTGIADFTGVVGFNTVTMEIDGRDGTHPGVLECAAGLAWVEYMAYRKFGGSNFLTGTRWSLNYLDAVDRNPMHNGVQMGYGALTAARMNAELGYGFDVDQIFRWIFGEGEPLRLGWGVIYGSWGGFEVSGLIGTEGSRGGEDRAYAKQGFHLLASLTPLVRYDQRYARAVGKWALHMASSARHYYQTYLPDACRDSSFWPGDADGVVPFESLRGNNDQSYFQDYLQTLENDPASNPEVKARVSAAVTNLPAIWGSGYSGAVNGGIGLCLYFGGDVGFLGGIVKPTNVEKILQLDLLRTDFYRDAAYPSYLYYNPFSTSKTVTLDVGATPVDVYDTVTHTFIHSNFTGVQNITIPANSARVVVLSPTGGQATVVGRKLLINGVVVDYYRQ